ncbi:EipB family protein [Thalassospira lucentensis]|uniref:EipB family protein n=1 Tax=Thalassospira lucentensis TaxID=168935 RepID=UPI003D2F5196
MLSVLFQKIEVGRRSFAGTLILCLGLSGCAAQAGNVSSIDDVMVPHVGEYHFKMVNAEQGSSIVDASGVLGYRFEKMCDGWVTEMQQIMILQGAEGTAINSAYSMTQWEDFAGSQYRFRMRDYLDGTKVDEIVGSAVRNDDGVTVTYEIPVEVVEELPADTMFPTQHSTMLLKRAQAGEKFANDLVFDGSGETPTNRIAAVISGAKDAATSADDPDKIASTQFHRMSLAFYPIGEAENGPSTEMAVDFGANGVAHSMRFDYGEFEVLGTLDKVSVLPQPECGS